MIYFIHAIVKMYVGYYCRSFGETNDCSIWQIQIQVHPYRGLQNNEMGLPSLKNMGGFFFIMKLKFTKRLFVIKEQSGQ